ncbi:MAG: polyphosphate kinase 1 [Chloroflexi bacterium]|nr:polyphosphate kinase 1 [Chloroflexota bacterium]
MATIELGRPPTTSPSPPAPQAITMQRPARLFNAQLSELDYIHRVLEEAQDRRHPLLERVKFLAISHLRLDEFFEVDVSGLRAQREGVQAGTAGLLPDGRTPSEALADVGSHLGPHVDELEATWRDVHAELRANGIHLLTMEELDGRQRRAASAYHDRQVFPVLTPLAVDPAHPFPHISHLSLNLAVMLEDPAMGELFARIKVPPNLPRLVPLPAPEAPELEESLDIVDGAHAPRYFVWLESLIAAHLEQLFPGVPVTGSYVFRVTRDYDQDIKDRGSQDLLSTVQQSLKERVFGFVVRIEFDERMPEALRARLREELEASEAITLTSDTPLGRRDLMALYSLDRPDIKYPPFVPRVLPSMASSEDLFAAIRRRDVLLHHPFDSFAPVVQFLEAASNDPDVLAIKQTLYRVGPNSPIVEALMRARENGKQVAVLLELKARGDEENNIEWALALEKAGVHVVYGIIGLKTHCKAILVVRREADGIRRYVHLGTGNYNAATARHYTDLGLFTCRPEIGADMTDLFNYLTGYSRQQHYRSLLASPVNWRIRLDELIDREIEWQQRGERGHLIFKINGLTDQRTIERLYRASAAGVQTDLIVRSRCCLRSGVPGLSENIRVLSIVGRFLEHHRLFYFRNGGDEEIYMGSADLMTRNLDRRVEIVCPIHDDGWRVHLRDDVLGVYLRDTAHTRELQPDGTYTRRRPLAEMSAFDAQEQLLTASRTGG